MSKTFQTRIKHKKDTHANWTTNNPVLLDGEFAIVVMTDGKIKTKIGDGVTAYNLLPFSSSDVTLSDLGITATTSELNSVDGVTSNIQTQLNAKVPSTRTVNGKALSSNISLTASDVGATSFTTGTITIAVEDWNSSTTAIKTDISYVTASNTLIVAPAPTSYAAWGNSKIRAIAQAAGSITFTCDTVPTAAISVNIVALG